jgi:hypothetical protein
MAAASGMSINGYLEALLFSQAKLNGFLPADAEPLGEGRGGKRERGGRPRKPPEPEQPQPKPKRTTASEARRKQALKNGARTSKARKHPKAPKPTGDSE